MIGKQIQGQVPSPVRPHPGTIPDRTLTQLLGAKRQVEVTQVVMDYIHQTAGYAAA